MGTPDFAKKSLEKIYNSEHEIIGVVTNIDKPKGRGMKVILSPVKQYAEENNIKIFQPEKVKKNIEFIKQIKELAPDVICVVAYGKILPKEILDIPKKGCVNVHGSLLPKYRGAAPIQWAVLNGDDITGITTIFMNEKMDEGDIILKKEIRIDENETTGQLWERLAELGADVLIETLDLIEKDEVKSEKQSDDFSVAPMIDKKMAKIDWENQTCFEIKNLVRGLNPIIGAYCYILEKKFKFWKVEKHYDDFEKYKGMANGTVIESNSKKGLFIKGKDGIIEVIEIQGENSKKMNILDFLRGNNIQIGTICK